MKEPTNESLHYSGKTYIQGIESGDGTLELCCNASSIDRISFPMTTTDLLPEDYTNRSGEINRGSLIITRYMLRSRFDTAYNRSCSEFDIESAGTTLSNVAVTPYCIVFTTGSRCLPCCEVCLSSSLEHDSLFDLLLVQDEREWSLPLIVSTRTSMPILFNNEKELVMNSGMFEVINVEVTVKFIFVSVGNGQGCSILVYVEFINA